MSERRLSSVPQGRGSGREAGVDLSGVGRVFAAFWPSNGWYSLVPRFDGDRFGEELFDSRTDMSRSGLGYRC